MSDAYHNVFRAIWFLTTIGCGVLGYQSSHGQFAGVLVGMAIGWVFGMILGFWLPIFAVLAAASCILWLVLAALG